MVFQAVIHGADLAEPIAYRFALAGPDGERFLGARGLAPDPQEAGTFRLCPGALAPFPVLPWTQGRVFYQVFPDRFANGDPSNDPPGTTPWGGPITHGTGEQYYGGDLAGLIDRLDYLAELGVGGIYLNPIFASGSSHGYDTVDYFRIDPRLGDLDTFRALLDEAHRREIRVILDAVFNHTGTGFWAFQDVMERGAASRYKDWYFFHGFPRGCGGPQLRGLVERGLPAQASGGQPRGPGVPDGGRPLLDPLRHRRLAAGRAQRDPGAGLLGGVPPDGEGDQSPGVRGGGDLARGARVAGRGPLRCGDELSPRPGRPGGLLPGARVGWGRRSWTGPSGGLSSSTPSRRC